MKNNEAIERMVEQTMSSLDSMAKVEANRFLYGKIQHRIADAKKQAGTYSKWMYGLALTLVVFLIVNGYSYNSFMKPSSQSNDSTGIEAVATDYNIRSTGDNI